MVWLQKEQEEEKRRFVSARLVWTLSVPSSKFPF